eukprot:scaffold17736_cov62-Phaeocystis_antarctica.AAC.5
MHPHRHADMDLIVLYYGSAFTYPPEHCILGLAPQFHDSSNLKHAREVRCKVAAELEVSAA